MKKAKSAVQKSETARKSQLDAKSKLDKIRADGADNMVVNTARRNYYDAMKKADIARGNATEEVGRAVKKLDIVINSRLTSGTRQQEARQAQAPTDRQARQSQEPTDQQARQA